MFRHLLPANQEGLPDYWGIETIQTDLILFHVYALIRKDYPTTGVLKLENYFFLANCCLRIRKDYPTTGVLKLHRDHPHAFRDSRDQEGLPDYWGIETCDRCFKIRIGVLIRKDYPTTGVLKPRGVGAVKRHLTPDQEGLPDYWGIETYLQPYETCEVRHKNQEGLPDYWGIETFPQKCPSQLERW